MNLLEKYNLDELYNLTEEMAVQELENILNENDKICKCQDCILDYLAIALNNLPPRYRVKDVGLFYPEPFKKDEIFDVRTKLLDAINKVSRQPNH